MANLFESPVPILAGGAVLATLAGLAFLSRRNLASLLALGGVVAATLLLLLIEQLVVTDREAVEARLAEMLAAIEANDTDAALALIDPAAANIRAQVEQLMPLVKVEDTGATNIRTEVLPADPAAAATTRFRGRLQGIHERSGQQVFYFDEVEIAWSKTGDNSWRMNDFVAYWRGKPIDALRSARSNQAVP